MREVFQDQLHEVQDRLVEMAESVTQIMTDASYAFINSDVATADRAIALAETNESKALTLDELVIRILARQSPVSRDLRILAGFHAGYTHCANTDAIDHHRHAALEQALNIRRR